jgi:glycine oxidase
MAVSQGGRHHASADSVIIGSGLIGLACAVALARDGANVILLDDARPGGASPAAAGMLAPSVDREDGPAHDFAVAARDRYPAYLAWLNAETGIEVPINTEGILQVAITARGVRGLRRSMPSDAEWIERNALAELEPELAHALGGVLHRSDGAVDNVALLDALARYCATSGRITIHRVAALEIIPGIHGASVRTADGLHYDAGFVVLAAGAWVPAIDGLPRPIPVNPARGQMLAFDGVPLRHVLFGPRGYIIPRTARAGAPAETLVGATTEHVGFDTGTTPNAATTLHSVAAEILPQLARAAPRRHWSGLRPMSPDLLPILGADPAVPRVLYACGHSRNGVLMAPLTGDCVSALVRGERPGLDLSPFRVDRFGV